MATWQSVHDQLAADLCMKEFEVFVREMWETIIPDQCSWGWHMSVMCQEIQLLAEHKFSNRPTPYLLIINVPPGSSKSTICSVMFPVWALIRDPSMISLCCSYGESLAIDLSIKSRQVIRSEKFQKLFGHIFSINKNVDSKAVFMTDKAGERRITSAGGSNSGGAATGKHAHFIVMDDPMKPEEATKDGECRAINEWIDGTLSTRVKDRMTTATILVMQRLSEMDTTQHFLDKGIPVRHICLPARLTEHVNPPQLSKYYKDGLLDPNRLPEQALEKMYLNQGSYVFSGQMLQSPYPLGDGMFKTANISVERNLPSPIKSVVRYWDKAASTGKKACHTVGTKIAELADGSFIVMDVKRGKWESEEREKIIRQTAELDGYDCVIVMEQEPASAGKDSVNNSIKRLAGFIAVADRPTGDKVLRADGLSSQVNVGNVKLLKAPWNRPFLHELEAFPNGKAKDQVDATAGGFNYMHRKKVVGTW